MKSPAPGKNTSRAEIQDITLRGVWLLANDREYFLPHDRYPWFKDAKVREIHNVQLLHGMHLHWPDLDVDLELESLDRPEKYPLTYR
ncbi:MAG: DUF2442 domain-containing protein [Elusimicrobia bacterium]|nr:DUF2442 domain-containing protein [Elusimicrobiota bacterium]